MESIHFEEVADDRLGQAGRHRLLDLLAAGLRDHGELGREPLDVLGLLVDEAHRDEQREGGVIVAGLLEATVEVALHRLPDGEAVGLMTMHP